jgi:hypothetical protein
MDGCLVQLSSFIEAHFVTGTHGIKVPIKIPPIIGMRGTCKMFKVRTQKETVFRRRLIHNLNQFGVAHV